jgi:hypothetical protein
MTMQDVFPDKPEPYSFEQSYDEAFKIPTI